MGGVSILENEFEFESDRSSLSTSDPYQIISFPRLVMVENTSRYSHRALIIKYSLEYQRLAIYILVLISNMIETSGEYIRVCTMYYSNTLYILHTHIRYSYSYMFDYRYINYLNHSHRSKSVATHAFQFSRSTVLWICLAKPPSIYIFCICKIQF